MVQADVPRNDKVSPLTRYFTEDEVNKATGANIIDGDGTCTFTQMFMTELPFAGTVTTLSTWKFRATKFKNKGLPGGSISCTGKGVPHRQILPRDVSSTLFRTPTTLMTNVRTLLQSASNFPTTARS